MKHIQFSILSLLTLALTGCYHDYDQQFISLESSMEVMGVGRTELRGVRDHEQMPMHYKLERDGYNLYADIHQDSIRPAVVFYIRGTGLIEPSIVGHPIRCNASFDPVRDSEFRKYGFPEDGYVFAWSPVQHPNCQKDLLPDGPERRLTLTVYDVRGNQVAMEELTFEIVSNGIRRENDSL
jgi:hypothetical protein